ncbi:cytochrome P450 [Glonium stellatum]|uniref:Cytochrome P450 n=1 Tax=Glonium stellatum TaxID=574774 RepID=A0A8E2JXX7_9PEZI|nr:cytochrome P450 [Glonium stellatum]
MDFHALYWYAAVIVGAFIGWKVLTYGMRPNNIPPGPPTIPLLGNLHQMPLKDFHFKFREWAQQYGLIVTLKVGGQNLILLNDESVIKDLLEERSNIYSARPDLFIREFGDNMNIAFRKDTQWNTLLGFIKAMILYPEAQAEAQREIDRIVGFDRLPAWEDRESLPYIRGVVEESLRWMPTTLSAAVPHSLLKDDYYNSYLIPKGSSMFINVWTLNNNVKDNPRVFDPARHNPESTAQENYGIDTDSSKRPHFTFGAGRRVCPGFHIAERGLFIAISRLLWAFSFSRKLDNAGNIIPIDRDAVTPGFIVRPVPYPAVIKPRDQGSAKIIRETWKEAQNSLDADGNFTEEFFERVFVSKTKNP